MFCTHVLITYSNSCARGSLGFRNPISMKPTAHCVDIDLTRIPLPFLPLAESLYFGVEFRSLSFGVWSKQKLEMRRDVLVAHVSYRRTVLFNCKNLSNIHNLISRRNYSIYACNNKTQLNNWQFLIFWKRCFAPYYKRR